MQKDEKKRFDTICSKKYKDVHNLNDLFIVNLQQPI